MPLTSVRSKSILNITAAPQPAARSRTPTPILGYHWLSSMPFGRLSPVDETLTESEDESLNSSRTASIDLRPRSLNFSRPSPQEHPSSRSIHREIQYATSTSSSSSIAGGSTRGIGAFYEAAPPRAQRLPNEPRFSSDDEGEDGHSVTTSSRSNNSDLVWDADTGELLSKRKGKGNDFDVQRSAAPRRLPDRSYPPRNDSTSTTTSDQPLIAELPGDMPAPHIVILQQRQRRQQQEKEQDYQQQQEHDYQSSDHYRTSEDSVPGIPDKTPRIIKRTSLSQRSERLSISSTDHLGLDRVGTLSITPSNNSRWNDSASHHTLKPSGAPSMAPSISPSTRAPSESGRSSLTSSDWKSSEYDISGLSEKKLAKLKKKGINPQLYMEMKAARGGKGKLVGPLVGNTYIG